MRKFLKVLATAMVVAISVVGLAGCKKDIEQIDSKSSFIVPPETRGNWYNEEPTVDASWNLTALDLTKDALYNYNVAMANMAKVPFYGSVFSSVASTQVGIKLDQAVDCVAYYDNVTGEYYSIAGSATVDNNLINIQFVEYTRRDPDGHYHYKKAEKIARDPKGNIVPASDDSWTIFGYYADKAAFDAAFPNGSYIYNEDTVTNTGLCTVEQKEGYVLLKLNFSDDVVKQVASDYVKTMKSKLPGGSEIDYKNLQVEIEIWNCGLLRKMAIVESYDMKIMGIINGKADMNPINYYTYDRSQCQDFADITFSTEDKA